MMRGVVRKMRRRSPEEANEWQRRRWQLSRKEAGDLKGRTISGQSYTNTSTEPSAFCSVV